MKIYVQLADSGALLNLLPLCLADADAGEKSCIITTQPYAGLLEGVSYVEHRVVDCLPHELEKAIDWARLNIKGKVISTQINGFVPDEIVKRLTYEPAGQEFAVSTSWQTEMWKLCGRRSQFSECLPLKFDRRDPVRETRLWRSVVPHGTGKKPIMLLALEGRSSPFPHKDLLRYLIQTTFADRWRIIELPQAERLYDLLALYEKSALLVAVDSAPLHLAWAARGLPVIALTNDKPLLWAGSSWRPNMVWYCRYGDWLERWQEMLVVIGSANNAMLRSERLFVWSEYETRRARNGLSWLDLPIYIGACGRDSAVILKDPKRVPFLRDCLRMAIQKATPGQQIILIRPDIEIKDDHIFQAGAAYAYRVQAESFAPICDLFTAPREWWEEALPELPDLLLGSDYWWSQCLWAIFRRRGAVDITGSCSRPAPTKKNPASTDLPPRIFHNVNLWQKYEAEIGCTHRYPAVIEQLETLPLDTAGLFRGGYNPTIIDRDGSIFMAYRYHEDTLATKLATVRVSESGAVEGNANLAAVGHSLEDPKFFMTGSELWMSWVEAYWPVKAQGSVRYGGFKGQTLNEVARPVYGLNDGDHLEKNWVFFNHKGELFFIYKSSPEVVIVRWSGAVEGEYITEGPRWPYGHIKGGTAPLAYEGKLLRFFHSTLDNEFAFPNKRAANRRYFLGACLMEPEPPFKTVAVSRKPIAYGSELGGVPDLFHFKPRVVFPGGVVERPGHWLLALGVNDSACVIAKIKPENLNL